eukprot:jgi/Mesvir1/26480/Mv16149-RA.1
MRTTNEDLGGNLTDARAKELVESASRELDNRFPTTGGSWTRVAYNEEFNTVTWCETNDSAFAQVLKRAQLGGQEERTLRKAGACVLYAKALDRILAGQCGIPLLAVCSKLASAFTSPNTSAAFAEAGGIDQLTRVLAGATEHQAWNLSQMVHPCIYGIASDVLACAKFGAAGTFPVVMRNILASLRASVNGKPEAQFTSCTGCTSLLNLYTQTLDCKDPGCPHQGRMGIDPSLPSALDTCLHFSVVFGSAMFGGGDQIVQGVCGAICVVAVLDEPPFENTRVLASDRVCQNLVTVCGKAVGQEYLTAGRAVDSTWMLASGVARAVGHLCRCGQFGIATRLRGACPHVALMLDIATAESYPLVQLEACIAATTLAQGDDANKACFVDAGLVETSLQVMRQAMQKEDADSCLWGCDLLLELTKEDKGVRRLQGAPKEATCKTLVDAVKFMMTHRVGADRDVPITRRMASLVGCWAKLMAAQPVYRQHLVDVGVQCVLDEALAMAEAEGDMRSANTFRDLKGLL